jgi:hypothetical protein
MTNELTTKFAVGDKVVAIDDACGYLKVGKYYTIECFYSGGGIAVKGVSRVFFGNYFKRPEDTHIKINPIFKAMKFKVDSPEQSKEIQEALFSMGYGWKEYKDKVMFIEDVSVFDWLYTEDNGNLWRAGSNEDYCKVFKSAQEYTIKTTKSYEFIPVENVVDTVELMGQKYSKKELEDFLRYALRSLKPIE